MEDINTNKGEGLDKQGEKNENSPNYNEEEYDWGKHPNSLEALKKHQFPKGVSGNVMGRKPTFEALSKALKKIGDEETFDWDNNSKGTRRQQVYERIWIDAAKGDTKKIQLLAWLQCI
jgi:hypothetical protein